MGNPFTQPAQFIFSLALGAANSIQVQATFLGTMKVPGVTSPISMVITAGVLYTPPAVRHVDSFCHLLCSVCCGASVSFGLVSRAYPAGNRFKKNDPLCVCHCTSVQYYAEWSVNITIFIQRLSIHPSQYYRPGGCSHHPSRASLLAFSARSCAVFNDPRHHGGRGIWL